MVDLKLVEERYDNGLIYQRVRFYEGDITTEDETIMVNGETSVVPVTRYRRSALLEEREYFYEAN